jgi:alpha-glucosidase (family GH31 glycosyl hydrolase)
VIEGLEAWVAHGTERDNLITLTEGVLVESELEEPIALGTDALLVRRHGPGHAIAEVQPGGAAGEPARVGLSWPLREGERLTGLGARHGLEFDQRGRTVMLGADRRYTGPDCPPDMLEQGGIPQGDYAPVPWLLSSAGYAVWVETYGPGVEFDLTGDTARVSIRTAAGPLRAHVFISPSPAASLRRYLRLSGRPALLPEWAYGHWKSRDVYEHQDDVIEDWRGYRDNGIPLDCVVIDSPWETQYNTWAFNPHQFPDAEGMVRDMRDDGVRTVVWVTPWVNLDSTGSQVPPQAESERLHSEPAPNYAEGAEQGHFLKDAAGTTYVGKWWMGTGSPVDFTSQAARDWWSELARPVFELGVEGVKADDGEGYYFPPDSRFADGTRGADAAWHYGSLYRETTQASLDAVHGEGRGVVFGRSGWSGQQATGMLWGGDQASDFWSLRALLVSLLTAAASGFSNLSHDVGGYLGERLADRCPPELLVRWAQLGALSPLMQAHGRFKQEAWTYHEYVLDAYREAVVLHERLVPYIRAGAALAAVSGLPLMRPACLLDPEEPDAWGVGDAYGLGPSLWVAPVVEEGARARRTWLPRGAWIDRWSGERVEGGGFVTVAAPLERIPVWVRAGAVLLTYAADDVRTGLGEENPGRAIEATLWGEPQLGHACARLADGTKVSWRDGEWAVNRDREVRFSVR